tara:strand:- start:14490 stop:16199 length:1710 start_codon:yes stop_codon:yes gene_type:complete
MDNDNFPLIETKSDYSSFFHDEIVFFYFHSVQFQKYTDFNSFSNRYETLLSVIKGQIRVDKDATLPYLKSVYKLIANTRDIRHGKGQHDVAYMMIWKLYKFFPILAIYMLYRFVKNTTNQSYTYGSWRDIKYLCGFVKQHSRHGENDSIIQMCIELVNTQLNEDLNTWKFSENAMDSRFISHVAKWIPRENKKFGWLFDLLANNWGETHYPYIIKSASSYDSQIRARNKYKQLYRKNVSFLNKALDTVEINLCANRRLCIEPNKIPLCSLSKYNNVSFYDSDDNDKLACSQQIINHLESKYSIHNVYNNKGKYNTSSSLPISYYVKQAISVIQGNYNDSNPQFYLLNKQWVHLEKVTAQTQHEYMIPIIDISSSMRKYDDEPLYAAIGYAILISNQSSIQNRIMIMDNNPVWIQFEDNMLFVHKVKRVLDILSSVYSTKTSYINTFRLIGNTFGDDINNMQFVIFSTFTEEQSPDTILYDTIMNTLSSYTNSVSHISFWNLSKHENTILPCLSEQNKTKLLSGYSPHLISQLYNPKRYYMYTPYINILYELNSYQYDILDEYINNLVCM